MNRLKQFIGNFCKSLVNFKSLVILLFVIKFFNYEPNFVKVYLLYVIFNVFISILVLILVLFSFYILLKNWWKRKNKGNKSDSMPVLLVGLLNEGGFKVKSMFQNMRARLHANAQEYALSNRRLYSNSKFHSKNNGDDTYEDIIAKNAIQKQLSVIFNKRLEKYNLEVTCVGRVKSISELYTLENKLDDSPMEFIQGIPGHPAITFIEKSLRLPYQLILTSKPYNENGKALNYRSHPISPKNIDGENKEQYIILPLYALPDGHIKIISDSSATQKIVKYIIKYADHIIEQVVIEAKNNFAVTRSNMLNVVNQLPDEKKIKAQQDLEMIGFHLINNKSGQLKFIDLMKMSGPILPTSSIALNGTSVTTESVIKPIKKPITESTMKSTVESTTKLTIQQTTGSNGTTGLKGTSGTDGTGTGSISD